ncbi:ABC transporter ATP-binding protein [Spiroplasma endosymbiont of Ammophila pubescens]|uniref:ABC transporter ATP-binding protein n=1 Tax=Spiroplasma endosymbiont of Ammophila pubescens TaxID=3066315 RepID=UPI0032B2BF3D
MAKVRCKKLFFEYKHKNILRDINLNIDDGQIIGLIGPNGAGKTTLIKIILGLIKKDQSLTLKYDDFVVNSKKVGFAPANNLFQRNISAKDILFYQAFITKLNYQKANELIPKVLKYFDLTEHAHKSFAKFSSGMKKKFLLALSLINDPDLLILDEPTANLDPETKKQVCELIFKLHQRNPKITIIIASHILSELESLINYVVILEEGQILCSKNFNYQQGDLEKLYYDQLKKVQKEPEEKELFF